MMATVVTTPKVGDLGMGLWTHEHMGDFTRAVGFLGIFWRIFGGLSTEQWSLWRIRGLPWAVFSRDRRGQSSRSNAVSRDGLGELLSADSSFIVNPD